MALAAFKMNKCTGANAATETDCNKHPCFLNADIVSADTGNHPIPAPGSALDDPNYSYEYFLRLECTEAPDNYCQNFKFWGPSNQPGDNLSINWGTTNTGVTPVDNVSLIAVNPQHNNYYSEDTALSIPVVPVDNKIDAIGEKTDYLVAQMKVEFGAVQGDGLTQVYNYQYEES